jgi:hypothetical protein
MFDRTAWRDMKCFACDGTGVECCPYCNGEGECAHCEGVGNGPCLLCDGVGEEPHPDSFDKKRWAEVPEPIRKIVEQHVAARLPAKILAKLRDLHARGLPISSDPAFFHFGGGMSVRNLCRQRLGDRELAACGGFGTDWDTCYIGVLAGIAAAPVRRSQAPVGDWQPRQLQFSFIEPELLLDSSRAAGVGPSLLAE